MSMISKQTEDLQMLSKILHNSMIISPKMEEKTSIVENRVKIIDSAIDTIRTLSAKVASESMEQSSRYYNDGWIPIDEREPQEGEYVLFQFKNYDDMVVGQRLKYSYELDIGSNFKREQFIAWQPLPEPYKESD